MVYNYTCIGEAQILSVDKVIEITILWYNERVWKKIQFSHEDDKNTLLSIVSDVEDVDVDLSEKNESGWFWKPIISWDKSLLRWRDKEWESNLVFEINSEEESEVILK